MLHPCFLYFNVYVKCGISCNIWVFADSRKMNEELKNNTQDQEAERSSPQWDLILVRLYVWDLAVFPEFLSRNGTPVLLSPCWADLCQVLSFPSLRHQPGHHHNTLHGRTLSEGDTFIKPLWWVIVLSMIKTLSARSLHYDVWEDEATPRRYVAG